MDIVSVKGLLFTLALLACGACTHRRAPSSLVAAPALAVAVSYLGQSGIGLGCLPRAGDSTRFEVEIVLDSLHDGASAALALIRRERSVPRLGYIYQGVSVEVQRASQT